MPPLLEVENLEVRAAETGHTLLRGTSFHVKPGECVAVLGPSGSGKTTLFRAINGTVPASAGTLRFAGQDVTNCTGQALRRLRRRIAVIPQKHDLVEPLRVHHNVTAGALGGWSASRAIRYLFWPTRTELATAEAALAKVNLAHKLHAHTRTLSGGEQQRVAIARALLQEPDLIIADEPVASLDPATAEEVLSLLCGLAERHGLSLLCSLHQPDLAARFFPRVIQVRKTGAAPSVAVDAMAAQ
ncbi:MAG TPA: ATP-binding cassette domain-containing protein [Rhodopila sp.]|nr:ATP-binding cassette domain-containing protein [Rhodopila sp.]